MSKGLALILEKIKASPSQTLVSRYLALISELKDDAEKSERALDLAAVLAPAKPADAMRIAHMVFRSDEANLRALDILIDCLVTRGRYAKAEVLRNERAKRAKAIAEGQAFAEVTGLGNVSLSEGAAAAPDAAAPTLRLAEMPAAAEAGPAGGRPAAKRMHEGNREARPPAQPARRAVPSPAEPLAAASPGRFGEADLLPPSEHSRITELDIDSEESTAERGLLDRLFPKDASSPAYRPSGLRDELNGAGGLLADVSRSTPPGDTVLPIGRGYRPAAPMTGAAPTVAMSGFGAVLELFDYYWRQGFVGDARELLKQTSQVAGHEPWWQARNALLEKSKLVAAPAGAAAVSVPDGSVNTALVNTANAAGNTPAPVALEVSLSTALATAARAGVVPPAPESQPKPLPAEDFWRPLQSEVARLAEPSRSLLVPVARVARLKELLAKQAAGRDLPEEFIRTLAELDRRLPALDAAKLLEVKWDLVQGLWAGAPDGACAALLEELELTRATPGFWGLYLDALVASGAARKALVEIRRGLAAKPHLIWARTAWQRLALIWMQLQVYGFPWNEDEGVPALLSRLAERPRPKAAGLVAMAAPRAKQTSV